MKIEMGKKYKTRTGRDVIIYAVGVNDKHIVHGCYLNEYSIWDLARWEESGKFIDDHEHPFDLVEVSPYDHIKIDDRVVVWDNSGKKEKRHFAGVSESGRPKAFLCGQTSFTIDKTVTWDNCELYKETIE